MLQRLEKADLGAAAYVLARAFRDNPGVRALLERDGADARQRIVETAMHAFARTILHVGVAEAIKVDGRIAAVSLAYPPGAFPPPLWAEVLAATGPLRAGPRRFLRFAALDGWMRERHLRAPHWYVWVLGVDPEQQGRGLGSALLRSLCDQADRDDVPCYLETDKPSSLRLYQKHGYSVRNEVVHAGIDLRLWFMLRPQRSAAAAQTVASV